MKYFKKAVDRTASFIADIIKKNLWIIILLFAGNYVLENKFNLSKLKNIVSHPDTKLNVEDGEVANAVIYLDDRIIIIQKVGEKPKQYVGVRKAKLTRFDDGDIKLDVKNKGIGIEPGLVMSVGDGLRIGADVKFAYWRRYGLLAGFTAPVAGRSINRIRGHLALGYDVPYRWFSATTLFGGIDTAKSPVFGARLRFGGGM